MSTVLVYCEHPGGNVRRASLEAIGAAASAGAEVVAVLWGEGASGAAASAAGAAKAVCLTGDATFSPDAVAAAVTEVAAERSVLSNSRSYSSEGRREGHTRVTRERAEHTS